MLLIAPEGPARRPVDRGLARPGLRPGPAQQGLLPLPRWHRRRWPSCAMSLGRAGRLVGAIRYWPLSWGTQPACCSARWRSTRAARAGHRPGADPGEPGAGRGHGLAAGVPGGRSRLLRPVRLRGGAGQHRDAGRKPGAPAVPDPGRRRAAARRRHPAAPRGRDRPSSGSRKAGMPL